MSLIEKLRANKLIRTVIAAGSLAYLVSCGSGSSNSNNKGNNPCVSEWSCGEYSECQPEGRQYRTCTDLNSCDPANLTKTASQDCIYDPCKDGECTVTVEHDGLVALAFFYQDRNNNGRDDLRELVENLAEGCSLVHTNECIKPTPEDLATSLQTNLIFIDYFQFEGINNKTIAYYFDRGIAPFINIPDNNMDNLIKLAQLYN